MKNVSLPTIIVTFLLVAHPAAAMEFSLGGYYDIIGTYTSQSSEISGNHGVDGIAVKEPDQRASDGWFEHEFVITPALNVTDDLSVKAKIFLAGSPPNNNNSGQTTRTFDDSDRNSYSIYVQHLYMDYQSGYGLFRLGRQSSDIYYGDFLNIDTDGHMLRWYSNDLGGGLKISAYLQKYGTTGEGSPDPTSSDNDSDLYSLGVYREAHNLTTSLWLDYFRDHSGTNSTDKIKLKGYYEQNSDCLHAMAEFAYVVGATDYATPGTPDDDIRNLAVIAELGVILDRVDISLTSFYASGDANDDADHKKKAAMDETYGLGSEFGLLTILTNTDARLLTGEDGRQANSAMVQAGVKAIAATSDLAATEKLTLHGAVAYAVAADEQQGWDDEYGWEIDLGLSYQIMDNLNYAIDGGYLFSGDFFKGADKAGENQNVLLVTNVVSMTF